MDIYDPDFQKKGCAVLLAICAAVLGFLVGYLSFRSGGVAASGLIAPKIFTLTGTASIVPSQTQKNSPSPSITTLPTYTAGPTDTWVSSDTPSPSDTPTQVSSPTQVPTDTPTEVIPTYTHTSTSTPHHPPNPPPPTTQAPPPPEPVVIESCKVDPSSVPVEINVDVTYVVQFSAPGYGFDTKINQAYPEQKGCSGADSDGDGMAYCVGSSGVIPAGTTVFVTLTTSVGDCVVSYTSR